MMRLALARAQGNDRDVFGCNCNELPCGRIYGVPIKFSIYLVFFFLYSLGGFVSMHAPWWCFLCLALGSFAILLLTILVHEFGHGLTARHFGGEILYILLWPLGGLCFHTMPDARTRHEKLWHDWWVVLMGPLTHLIMIPFWIVVEYSVLLAFGMAYSFSDILSGLNPLSGQGVIARHPEVRQHGWGASLLLQLCATAIQLNVMLFLFNMLLPMFPMDASKLLCTGMQLLGTPVQVAAKRFIYISGVSAIALFTFAIYDLYISISKEGVEAYIQHVSSAMGLGLLPVQFSVLAAMGLAFWGGKQTLNLKQLADDRQLHIHPLFCHVPFSTKSVRDIAHGRPDCFVERREDVYESETAPAAPQAPQATYGAVHIRDGQIHRRPHGTDDPSAARRQVVVMQ
eukprot:TRINITY_DN8312_c0_g1_i2.p1 TRINITY_DN8312_c0_g1~~TRINITY_DN8312_c0_g1_i2.p1  ORF type:complete len:399 (+),score=42.49 TRINITY_DN8312_c0_g1_i2:41-1237(+)